MAAFGARYLVFAPFKEEPKDALPKYDEKVEFDPLVKAELTVNKATGELYGDDRLAEKVDEYISGTLAVEVTEMDAETESKIFGSKLGEGEPEKELVDNTADAAPYGGLGYIKVILHNGKKEYRACFYPKTQAAMGNDAAQTKSSSITLGTTPLTFTIYEPNTGDWRYRKTFDTEAAAKAYIDGKLTAVE